MAIKQARVWHRRATVMPSGAVDWLKYWFEETPEPATEARGSYV